MTNLVFEWWYIFILNPAMRTHGLAYLMALCLNGDAYLFHFYIFSTYDNTSVNLFDGSCTQTIWHICSTFYFFVPSTRVHCLAYLMGLIFKWWYIYIKPFYFFPPTREIFLAYLMGFVSKWRCIFISNLF